eukprot:TRINITY_DN924_c0_g1_i1.p1 TRINITY_DN924_c0_g1~~TRINITY_DN924_c0_g1_i1.p1  ORF type:complete len:461 (-),score=151.43 TRINITY_DN924_c0_g1_i1:24-1382(-)
MTSPLALTISFILLFVASVLAITSIPLAQHYSPDHYIEYLHESGDYAKVHSPEVRVTRDYLETNANNAPLAGNVFQVVTDITIGAQTFRVQVDTGSALMAVPYHSCDGCEGSPNPLLASSPAKEVGCDDDRCNQQQCRVNTDTCGFEVTYVDNSNINGIIMSDRVTVGGLAADNVLFGAIQQATANFEAPVADGIIGFSYNSTQITCSPNCVAPVFDVLVQSTGVPNIFAMLIDYNNGGTLTLGGVDESLYTGEVHYVPVTNRAFWAVTLRDIQVEGTSVVSNSAAFGLTIVDSGTSLTYFPQSVYNSIKNHFQVRYASLPLVNGANTLWKGSDYCLVRRSLLGLFPTIQFVFDGVTIRMTPDNYLYQSRSADGTTIFCLGLNPTTSGHTILGDTFMRGLYVIFDKESNQVGFAGTSAHPTATGSSSDSSSAPVTATISAAAAVALAATILM